MTRTKYWLFAAVLTLGAAACSDELVAGGEGVDAGIDDDPLLSITADFEPGSLEELQVTIIQERCSGQPGLCHNSQFEPNLSTTANTYAYLVNRPALENGTRRRVDPTNPNASFLIDKIRNRNVQTQMPLGAEPLSEDEIQMVEDWISDGALRSPGADAPVVLNEPPLPPEIGVFNAAETRLDSVGSFFVSTGETVMYRHSVSDFETADADIGFAVVILSGSNGMNLVLNPTATDGSFANGQTVFNAAGPMGAGDLLNYEFPVVIPADGIMDMVDGAGTILPVDVVTDAVSFTPIVLYLDLITDGIVAFAVGNNPMVVQ